MATVAIVAHSRAGNTWRLAEAVCDGARIADAQVHLIRIDEEGIVDEAGWDNLAVADGIIFGCPTHGRTLLAIQTFRRCHVRAAAHPVARQTAGFTNSTGMSGDKFSTLTYFWTLASTGHGVDRLRHKPSTYDKAALAKASTIGGYGGAMATNHSMTLGHVASDSSRSGVRSALRHLPGRRKNPEHPLRRLHQKVTPPRHRTRLARVAPRISR